MIITLDRYIETTADIRGGKPRIAGTRIAVGDLAIWHLDGGQSLEEIAAEHDLSLAAVHAAMAYYYDHQAEIADRLRDDAAYAESLRQIVPSRLPVPPPPSSHA